MKSLLCLLLLFCVYQNAGAQTNISGSFFDCPELSNLGSARTVHELKPSDIRVIGAMGDSLTAGFGVLSNLSAIYTIPTDFRGLAWSGGGDASIEYVTTLPNILKNYNPELYGFSEGTTPILNFTDLPNVNLNVARSGGHASELLGQAQLLVEKIKSNPEINIEEDWKLITILIGFNDVCQYPCTGNPLGEPEIWIANITSALDFLQAELPRTFVNVVQISNVESLQRQIVMSGNPLCRVFQNFICECGLFGNDSIPEFSTYLRNYKLALETLTSSDRYTSNDTFTVVLQPFLRNTALPFNNGLYDISSLAVDCAHLSPDGNRLYATALWNNMLQPVGQKQLAVDFEAPIRCPTDEQPFFFTELNSKAAASVTPTSLVMLMLLVLVAAWEV